MTSSWLFHDSFRPFHLSSKWPCSQWRTAFMQDESGLWLVMLTSLRVVCSVLLIGGGAARVASAQAPDGDSAPAVIATDRPSVTDSSAVVPNMVFQAENGTLDTDNQGRRTLDFPETLIRVGIAPSTELRLTAPDYSRNYVIPAGLRSGLGDLMVGIKQQLCSVTDGFEIAAIVSLSVPTGVAGISSHGYDPSFQLPWSHKLSSNWTAAGMLSVYVPTQNSSHSVVGEATFLVDRQLTKDWDAFTEYAGDFPQAGDRATWCTSEQLIRLRRSSNSICMWESGCPSLPWITSSGSATRFVFEWTNDDV